MVNPLPIFSRSSRWWFIRNVARLLTSGAHRVEFTDFWLGDQFCSLIFTLGNLYLVVCAYVVGFDGDISQQCSKPRHWGVPFVLSSLPLLVRLVQSVKRYIDSKLITHLINGGKYGMGIVYYLCYWIWRHNNVDRGPSFVLFCLFGTIYTVYATSWDFLMDWSVLRPHAKHPLLRDEVVYTSQVPLYYCAILLNLLLRFSWAFLYIPAKGPSFNVRTFITGMLEMLRRWQWNFYRLENEHVGNVDQYRITREVPLPYSFDDLAHDSDVGDEDDETPPS
ncbi:EXS-domain-containing protein [Amylostereum chailletii]|nr:EXS-domain-containing protein [Amylostereum chailletii]